MDQTFRAPQSASPKPHKRYSALSTIAKSLIATTAVAGIVAAASSYYSGNPFFATQVSGDSVSDAQKAERIHAFEAVGTLELSAIANTDIPRAVESMGLAASSKQALLSDLTTIASTGTSPSGTTAEQHDAPASPPNAAPTQTSAIQSGSGVSRAVGGAIPLPNRKQAARLAWVTLWDTDTEDGDTVRIDSQGYSRTVVLTKQPVTFALPVPADGGVKITGMRDGEGGGITIGMASGASQAILPIMSVGQVLNLKVRVN